MWWKSEFDFCGRDRGNIPGPRVSPLDDNDDYNLSICIALKYNL